MADTVTRKTIHVAIWQYVDIKGDRRYAHYGDTIDFTDDELQRATAAGVFDQPPPGPRPTPFIVADADPDQLRNAQGYSAGIWSAAIDNYFTTRNPGPISRSTDPTFNAMPTEPPAGPKVSRGVDQIDTPASAAPPPTQPRTTPPQSPDNPQLQPPPKPKPEASPDTDDQAELAERNRVLTKRERQRAGRVRDCVDVINELGIPRRAGAPKIRDALRAAGYVFANEIITEAVRARKLPNRSAS